MNNPKYIDLYEVLGWYRNEKTKKLTYHEIAKRAEKEIVKKSQGMHQDSEEFGDLIFFEVVNQTIAYIQEKIQEVYLQGFEVTGL